MATLQLQTRDQFVANEIAAIQAALPQPNSFQFAIGSIVRALVEAHAGTAIWEESLIQFVLARTRLATSTGNDCDTFVADFGLSRVPAIAATGNVTFSSNVATTQRLIPANSNPNLSTIVSTVGNGQQFAVIIDTGNANWNAALNAYVLAVNTTSIMVPVIALVPGTLGNVNANTVTVINSPLPGVDFVNNASAFTTGANAQTDPQLRAYFVTYLNSLSRANKSAIAFAILSIVTAQGVPRVKEYYLQENTNYSTGAQQLGYFFAIIDDGTGTPPDSLVTEVSNAINLYRGFTIQFGVYKPVVQTANVSATVTLPAPYDSMSFPTLSSDIATTLTTYINLIPIGQTLFYSRLYQIIYSAIQTNLPNLIDQIDVTAVLLNGGTSDFPTVTATSYKNKVVPGTISITILP